MLALHDAEIAQWDSAFDELLAYLDKESLLRNALVVVTSDHGESFYDHYDRLHDVSLFNEALQVPLVARLPGGSRAGIVSSPVSNRSVAGSPLDHVRRGEGATFPGGSEEKTIAQWSTGGGTYRGASIPKGGMKSIPVVGGEKQHRFPFDHATDPKERSDLFREEGGLFTWEVETLVPSAQADLETVPLSREEREQMEAIGYTR